MKKVFAVLMSSLITLSLAVGCASKNNEQEVKEPVTVNVGAPDGLPAIAIAKLSQENPEVKEGYKAKYTLEATSDALSTDVMKEALDIAIVPSNMASIAYNKTSNYQIAGTVGMGSFYLVSSDKDVTGLNSSLQGKEVGNIGKGLTPDITVQALLKEQKVDSSAIKFNYSNEASDLVSLLATNKLSTAIVPEPALSGLLTKNADLKVICGVNDTWKDVFKNENGYPQSTLIIKSSFAKENPEFVSNFIKILDANIKYTNENPKEAGEFALKFGVNIKAPLLAKAIDRTNLKFIAIDGCKDDYVNYYNSLSSFNPKVLGGKVPDDNIYYTQK
ncbi:ABC transporter substrate-binding protein [Terrisporobacter petrolearius]|uniref:ABC transporter substrate-binding protein n=1 Tax=Terrisporobacter petrolearius TaxID=1460447 RepID=UPI0031CCA8D2